MKRNPTKLRSCSLAMPRNGTGKPRVLVAGGAGYIGSHVSKALFKAEFQPIAFDNLSTGHRWAVKWGHFIHGDLADFTFIREVLRAEHIDAVIHLAGSALVGESMKNPAMYFRNNIANSINLLEAMQAEGVPRLVFSSSCAVYGNPESLPISEDHPRQPSNPYGESKLAIERQLGWYGDLCGLQSVSLRYFNAAGADEEGELGEDHQPETHLIPLTIRAALREGPPLTIHGSDYPTPDGTAVRDYVHVADIADAHVRALRYLFEGGLTTALNLGGGTGRSIRQVIASIEKVVGRTVPHVLADRRPGDPAVLIADSSRARTVLGWEPRRKLAHILQSASRWEARPQASQNQLPRPGPSNPPAQS